MRISLHDWGVFINDVLRGREGNSKLLFKETIEELHKPYPKTNNAFGWMEYQRNWGGGIVYHHTGSDGANFANIWIIYFST